MSDLYFRLGPRNLFWFVNVAWESENVAGLHAFSSRRNAFGRKNLMLVYDTCARADNVNSTQTRDKKKRKKESWKISGFFYLLHRKFRLANLIHEHFIYLRVYLKSNFKSLNASTGNVLLFAHGSRNSKRVRFARYFKTRNVQKYPCGMFGWFKTIVPRGA